MKIYNSRAKHDYFLYETFEAGLVLLGTEARALHNGRGDISNAFARIRNGEMYLVGANIPPHTGSGVPGYDPTRSRKLLMHKAEIVSLGTKMKQQNLILVPISVYNTGSRVKIELALAKGKRKFDKKSAKRKKDLDRLVEIEIRGKGK